jgi:predicted ester cyclase
MAAEEYKAIIQRAARRFSDPAERGNYLELYDDNIVMHGLPGVEPGIASVRQFYQAFWSAFPDAALTLEDLVGEGDKVACRFVVRGTHQGEFQGIPPTGRQVAYGGVTIMRFEHGRCVERWSEADTLGMLQQLGVIPQPEAQTA